MVQQGNSFRIIYEGFDCPFDDFSLYKDAVYFKNVSEKNISNALFIKTKCIYKGYQFDVSTSTADNMIGIVTDDKVAYEKLNLDFREPGVYQKEVFIIDVDKLWEEYSPSSLNLPMPEGLPKERVIEIPKRDL
jgi:hypothetical protein